MRDDDDIVEQIVDLVAAHTGFSASTIGPSSRLLQDLKMDGDDAVEFFEEISQKYEVDLRSLDSHWREHFGPEASWPSILAILVSLCAGLCLAFLNVPLIFVVAILLCFAFFLRRFEKKPEYRPVKIQDVIEAVGRKEWLLIYQK